MFSKALNQSRTLTTKRCTKTEGHALIQQILKLFNSSATTENILIQEDDTIQHIKPYSDIPGPRAIPILGNTWRVMPLIGQYDISDTAKVSFDLHKEYGKIVKLSNLVGRPDLLFLYDADEIEKVYRQESITPYRPSMPCLVKYKGDVRKDFFGNVGGVVGVHGEQWKKFRTTVQKPILQIQTVKKYIEPIEDVTKEFISKMLVMKNSKEEMPGDFDNEIHKWALECIGRVALDTRLGCMDPNLPPDSEPQKIIDAAKYALRNIAIMELRFPFWRYFPTTLWTRYVANMDYFVEICTKYIDAAMERLESKVVKDEKELSLIERILASEKDPKIATIFALDLILVGIDTISMAVCSILYQLATRQEQQEKLFEELKEVLPDPEEPLTAKKLDSMVFLKAFVKEVFRMYSTVIGNGRTLQEDTVLLGYKVPKGVQVVFPTVVTGNMNEYITEAHKFYPERWMKEKCGNHYIHPFASLPYGYGARMCLGRRFADLEIQVLLAKLFRSYKLEYNHKPLDYKVTFMYAPDGELTFKMAKR
nr:unnamed protein product [Callosobruchus analis]